MGRADEAETLFRRAVEADDPKAPQARWKLAAAHLRAGRVEAALALLLPLQYTHPDQYEVAVGLGRGERRGPHRRGDALGRGSGRRGPAGGRHYGLHNVVRVARAGLGALPRPAH